MALYLRTFKKHVYVILYLCSWFWASHVTGRTILLEQNTSRLLEPYALKIDLEIIFKNDGPLKNSIILEKNDSINNTHQNTA